MLKRKPKTKTQIVRAQAEEVRDRIAPHVESAREKAAPYVAEARVKAAPVVEGAREKAAPVVENAKTKFATEVLPVITAAVVATEEAREEAKKRGAATAAALKGELDAPKKKDSHKLRNLLLVLGLSGLVAFVAKKMSERDATTAWQSSYTPSPSSTSTSTGAGTTPTYSAPGVAATDTPVVDETPMGTAAAAAAAANHDEGGAGPDEAAADATDVPHPATTPDNPVEEIKVDDDRS